jgi:hypothetical protein
MTQAVEHLPYKPKYLSSNPSITKNKNIKRKKAIKCLGLIESKKFKVIKILIPSLVIMIESLKNPFNLDNIAYVGKPLVDIEREVIKDSE